MYVCTLYSYYTYTYKYYVYCCSGYTFHATIKPDYVGSGKSFVQLLIACEEFFRRSLLLFLFFVCFFILVKWWWTCWVLLWLYFVVAAARTDSCVCYELCFMPSWRHFRRQLTQFNKNLNSKNVFKIWICKYIYIHMYMYICIHNKGKIRSQYKIIVIISSLEF